MPHRSPTAADIGKTVEFSLDGHQWHTAKLSSIDYDETGPLFWQSIEGRHRFFNHCRVPYSCPDPIAELSEAADLLAERGADEASKILALFAAMDNSQRNYILRMIEEKDERLRPFEFRMMMQDYGNVHFDRRSLYRPST